jgi:hypothetical protein
LRLCEKGFSRKGARKKAEGAKEDGVGGFSKQLTGRKNNDM